MTTDELVSHYGTQTAAARAAGLHQTAVSLWVRAGRIPFIRQCQYEVLTGGALKAERQETQEVEA